MADLEVIEFENPSRTACCLYLARVKLAAGVEVGQGQDWLREHFSCWGLLHSCNLKVGEDCYYCYVWFYSARAASAARRDNRGERALQAGRLTLRIGRTRHQTPSNFPLARYKCEELANYYLSFNGWSSTVLYQRVEETEPSNGRLCIVSVVKLDFPGTGHSCEGAGQCEADWGGKLEDKAVVLRDLHKKAKAEAMQAAWSKVVLVVVDGSKVVVEINTSKSDKFFYDPLWEEISVTVTEAAVIDDEEESLILGAESNI